MAAVRRGTLSSTSFSSVSVMRSAPSEGVDDDKKTFDNQINELRLKTYIQISGIDAINPIRGDIVNAIDDKIKKITVDL